MMESYLLKAYNYALNPQQRTAYEQKRKDILEIQERNGLSSREEIKKWLSNTDAGCRPSHMRALEDKLRIFRTQFLQQPLEIKIATYESGLQKYIEQIEAERSFYYQVFGGLLKLFQKDKEPYQGPYIQLVGRSFLAAKKLKFLMQRPTQTEPLKVSLGDFAKLAQKIKESDSWNYLKFKLLEICIDSQQALPVIALQEYISFAQFKDLFGKKGQILSTFRFKVDPKPLDLKDTPNFQFSESRPIKQKVLYNDVVDYLNATANSPDPVGGYIRGIFLKNRILNQGIDQTQFQIEESTTTSSSRVDFRPSKYDVAELLENIEREINQDNLKHGLEEQLKVYEAKLTAKSELKSRYSNAQISDVQKGTFLVGSSTEWAIIYINEWRDNRVQRVCISPFKTFTKLSEYQKTLNQCKLFLVDFTGHKQIEDLEKCKEYMKNKTRTPKERALVSKLFFCIKASLAYFQFKAHLRNLPEGQELLPGTLKVRYTCDKMLEFLEDQRRNKQ